jgi:GntR family transcriptional regulator / MocR family aminotransferase
MFLELDGRGPLHLRLYRALRAQILAARFEPGARLPSTRALAASLGVSRNTVLLAYEQLFAEGYARSRAGARPTVTSALANGLAERAGLSAVPRRPRPAEPGLARAAARMLALARERPLRWDPRPARLPYDFRVGRPPARHFPYAMWCRILARRARRAGLDDLDYGPPNGRAELREALAKRLQRQRGIDTSPERIVIVNGSQQALDLISRVLIEPGDRVLIEEPHYLGARSVFAAAGAELVAAPVDRDGMQVPAAGPRGRAPRLAYVTPSHQFPTGAVMPLVRRLELLNWAARSNAFIVEDDYDSEYRYEGRPLQALAGLDADGRVIYVGTFSKLMFPGLRLGYAVLPRSLVAPIVAAKAVADTCTAALHQLALADFIAEGHFERHLHRSTARNRQLRTALLQAISEHFGQRAEVCGANAGLHILAWIRGHNGKPVGSAVERARRVGVGLYSVAPYYLKPPQRTGVLLGYGMLGEREIREGIARLASALA